MKKVLSMILMWSFVIGSVSSCATFALEEQQKISPAEPSKKALVIGGTSGLGLATAVSLKKQGYDLIIVGRKMPNETLLKMSESDKFIQFNLINDDLSFLDDLDDINALVFVTDFEDISSSCSISDSEILTSFNANTAAAIQTIKKYYNKIASDENFRVAVVTSMIGKLNPSLFTLYSTTNVILSRFIESINVEIEAGICTNKIFYTASGYLEDTKYKSFGELLPMAENILNNTFENKESTIPLDKKLFEILTREHQSSLLAFGDSTYKNRINNNRRQIAPNLKVGYLPGTFDLFHIGHLNILRNAKKYCDYLIVGVHKDASHKGKETFIPLNERMDIVQNIKYVDECIVAPKEDNDAYDTVKYDYLIIGSDRQGSEAYKHHEKYFADKGVKIIYLPYTKSTSSTQLRQTISNAA